MSQTQALVQATIKRRPGGRSARNAQAVLNAALTIMQCENRVPSVEELAQRAGIQKSSIYRRWGTVEGVVLEAVNDRLETTLPIPDTGSARLDLRAYLDASLAFHLSPMGSMLTQLVVGSSDEFKTEYWPGHLEAARKIVERGQARGEVRIDIDTHTAMEMLIAPLYFRSLITNEVLDEALIDDLLKIIGGIFSS